MERWGVSVNDCYKTGHVCREEGPWYVFFIEWLSEWLCEIPHRLPSIPLPKWRIRQNSFLGSDLIEPDEVTTLQEWYGDIAGLIHSKIHDPIFQWCHKQYKETRMEADIDDLEVFADWVAELKESDSEDEDEDSFRNHPKFQELEAAREEIRNQWAERKRISTELMQIARSSRE